MSAWGRFRLPRALPHTVVSQLKRDRIDGDLKPVSDEDHQKSMAAARERVARSENGRAWLERISKI